MLDYIVQYIRERKPILAASLFLSIWGGFELYVEQTGFAVFIFFVVAIITIPALCIGGEDLQSYKKFLHTILTIFGGHA